MFTTSIDSESDRRILPRTMNSLMHNTTLQVGGRQGRFLRMSRRDSRDACAASTGAHVCTVVRATTLCGSFGEDPMH